MTPKDVRGWSQGGKLVSGKLLIPVGATNPQLVRGTGGAVTMQADLLQEDSLTVQFNITNTFPCNAQAEIVSSVQGNAIRRLIAVADGASITTRGKAVRVVVKDFTAPAISDGRNYNVQILGTLGVRAPFKQPPYLTPLVYRAIAVGGALLAYPGSILVPGGTETFVPVPEDAGVNSVLVTVISGNPAVVFTASEIIVLSNTAGGTVINQYSPITNPDWIPLTPSTNQISIRNSGVPNAVVSVFFGIDG